MNIRTSIINQLIARYGAKSYLEIGCQNRDNNFNHIICEEKECVDIDPAAKADYTMSSDEFFRVMPPPGCSWDIIFIDGDHSYDQASRDLQNALRCKPMLVIMHDTHPLNEQYTHPGWSGEVYKVIVDLYNGIPDTHKYETYLEDRHGLTVIHKLTEGPRMRISCDSYKQFRKIQNEILNVRTWH